MKDEEKDREDWEEKEQEARNQELMKLVDGLAAGPEARGLLGMVALACVAIAAFLLLGGLR